MSPPDDSFVVVEEQTIERGFGWVFFYNSAKFLKTTNPRDSLLGNGPIIVNRNSGTVEFYGSGTPIEDIIEAYEKRLVGRWTI